MPISVRFFLRATLVAFVSLVTASARAGEVKVHPPLVELPRERLIQLAPLLRTGDFAVLESDARGWERQITTLTLAKAPPEVVRDVVIHPERYEDFVRNMVGRSVKQNPDGTFDHTWKLSFSIASFSGVNRYRLLPARPGEPVGAVELYDPTGMSTYRWEFLSAAHGGGTIVVMYGYTDVRHSGGLMDKLLARADTLEHGLSLITQLTWHRAMTEEAEKKKAAFPPYVAPGAGTSATSFGFLLDRGLVAILRRSGGKLVDFSLIDRSRAAAHSLLDELAHPERWTYIPSIDHVSQKESPEKNIDGMNVVEIEQSLPLMRWTTLFGVRGSQNGPSGSPAGSPAGSVDLFGLEGDLRGGRIRFDVRPDREIGREAGNPTQQPQQLILRGQLAYDRASVVLRNLFKIEPLFEDGVNVGLTFVVLRAVKAEVEKRANIR